MCVCVLYNTVHILEIGVLDIRIIIRTTMLSIRKYKSNNGYTDLIWARTLNRIDVLPFCLYSLSPHVCTLIVRVQKKIFLPIQWDADAVLKPQYELWIIAWSYCCYIAWQIDIFSFDSPNDTNWNWKMKIMYFIHALSLSLSRCMFCSIHSRSFMLIRIQAHTLTHSLGLIHWKSFSQLIQYL